MLRVKISLSFLLIVASAVSVIAPCALVASSDATVRAPFDSNNNLPNWISILPIPEGDAQNFLQFQINAPRANNTQALFITVFFRDRANGYLKASWETDAGQNYLLSENLFEGTGVPNQRSFLISSDRITNTNTLIFEAQENIDALIKVQFQWVSAETIHIIPEEHPSEPKLLLVDSNNKTYSQHDLSGEPQQPTVDYWQGRVINAAVIETYARIDEGVRFFVTLEKQPLHARIQTQIIGPALLDRIGVWVNDQYAGILNIEVPSLATSGIFERPNRQAYFAGWRQGTIYIDPKLLDSGENSILFEIRRRDPRDIFPIHIKDFYLQLAY